MIRYVTVLVLIVLALGGSLQNAATRSGTAQT